MQAHKARKLFNLLEQLAKGQIIWMPTVDEIEKAFVEIALLEYEAEKASKLDSGVTVYTKDFKHLESYWCSNCDTKVNRYTVDKNNIVVNNKYCSNCGTKLIFPEIKSIDDEPKAGVLDKTFNVPK